MTFIHNAPEDYFSGYLGYYGGKKRDISTTVLFAINLKKFLWYSGGFLLHLGDIHRERMLYFLPNFIEIMDYNDQLWPVQFEYT